MPTVTLPPMHTANGTRPAHRANDAADVRAPAVFWFLAAYGLVLFWVGFLVAVLVT
jgi:hypothetical protein